MRAGRLRESIQIWSHTTTQDEYGQETKAYSLVDTVRAEAKPLSVNQIGLSGTVKTLRLSK